MYSPYLRDFPPSPTLPLGSFPPTAAPPALSGPATAALSLSALPGAPRGLRQPMMPPAAGDQTQKLAEKWQILKKKRKGGRVALWERGRWHPALGGVMLGDAPRQKHLANRGK